jgi:hypothetical protein
VSDDDIIDDDDDVYIQGLKEKIQKNTETFQTVSTWLNS